MKLTKLSDIGKGPLFHNLDVMGMGEGPNMTDDENWVQMKEDDIMNKMKRGEDGLVFKNDNLKMKMETGANKLKNNNFDINNKMSNIRGAKMKDYNKGNLLMGMGGQKKSPGYSNKVEMIMGKQGKANANWGNKVNMVMGGNMKKQKAPTMNNFLGGGSRPKGTHAPKVNMMMGGGNLKSSKMPNINGLVFGNNNPKNAQNKLNTLLGKQVSSAKTKEINIRKLISGTTKNVGFKRIEQQKGLDMMGDFDGDKVMNVLDCDPLDPNKQGRFHDWMKAAGGAVGGAVTSGARRVSGAVTSGAKRLGNIAKYGKNTEAEFQPGYEPETWAEKSQARKLEKVGRETDVAASKYGLKDIQEVSSVDTERPKFTYVEEPGKSMTAKQLATIREKEIKFQTGQEKLERDREVAEREAQFKKATFLQGISEKGILDRRLDVVTKGNIGKQIAESRVSMFKAKTEAGYKEDEGKSKLIKAASEAEFKEVEGESKLIRARADMVRAQKASSVTSKKGKKGTTKFTDVYDEQQDIPQSVPQGVPQQPSFGGGFYGGSPFSQLNIDAQEGQLLTGGIPFRTGYVSPNMGVGASGQGVQNIYESLRGTGSLNLQSQSSGYEVQPGQGFRQMMGLPPEQPMVIPEPQVAQPQMVESQPQPQPQQLPSGEIKEFGGIRYMKMPDGTWKNMRSGDIVTYHRGSYDT